MKSNYSYLKVTNYLKLLVSRRSTIALQSHFMRLLYLHYMLSEIGWLAAGVAFIYFGILFSLSGYNVNLEIYRLIKHEQLCIFSCIITFSYHLTLICI